MPTSPPACRRASCQAIFLPLALRRGQKVTAIMVWLIAIVLFAAWFVGKFIFGREGFIHILLLCAVSVAVVQLVHERRAAR